MGWSVQHDEQHGQRYDPNASHHSRAAKFRQLKKILLFQVSPRLSLGHRRKRCVLFFSLALLHVVAARDLARSAARCRICTGSATVVPADMGDVLQNVAQEDPLAALRKVSAERLQANSQGPPPAQ